MAKKRKNTATVSELIDEINARLDSLEDMISFTIRADSRFRVGQRVRLNEKAKQRHIRGKRGVATGRVVRLSDSFTMDVLLDGYKQPRGYHHSFFDPA